MPSERSGPRSDSARPGRDLPRPNASPPAERADAARNRARILATAAGLFAERGVASVSMDDVAVAAGVGKGTLFRRFGDKAGLAVALLDERERALQQAVLSGPPPVGPGALAAERLVAFLHAYLDYAVSHLELVRMSETASPGSRYRIGSYWFWRRHVALLLAESVPGLDADVVSHALLAGLSADLLYGIRDEVELDRYRDGLLAATRHLLRP